MSLSVSEIVKMSVMTGRIVGERFVGFRLIVAQCEEQRESFG